MGLRSLPPSTVVKSAEGQYRDGPWYLPITGGWLPAGSAWNFWQMGQDVQGFGANAMVEACVSAYAQTLAMCPGDHWRLNADGGRTRVTNSALSRILRRPNGYQSISDFLLNTTRSFYCEGNAYALALRNDRFEISELHLMDPRRSSAIVAETGEVFYKLSGNELIERQLQVPSLIVPARDVLHIRLHTPRHPLKGETPLTAAAMDVAASGAMTAQQYAFYINQSRPSQVLSTDQKFTPEQTKQLRELWDEQSRGLNTGGTPILTSGLKPVPMTISPQDAQLADIMKLTEQHIALVFRIPLQILGIGGGTAFASMELLMQAWIASGLGFALNHVEEAFGQLFALKGQPDEYLEFDTEALLRSSLKDRMEAYARGVQGSIYSPNEARLREGLPKVEFGDEPRAQQQLVPLSAADKIPAAPGAPAAPPAPSAPAEPSDKPDGQADPEKDAEHAISARRAFRRTVYADAA